MKKRIAALFLATACAVSLSACGAGKENQGDNNIIQDTENREPGHPSEGAGTVVRESPLGYSMKYDPSVFTFDDTGESDVFTYNQTVEAPVYLSVQKYSDMDAQTLAEGLVLQSGIDGVKVQDANFGADGIAAKLVYVEKEVEGVKRIQIFYGIPAGEGSLLVEMGSYVGVSENVDAKFEEMLGTFSLKEIRE